MRSQQSEAPLASMLSQRLRKRSRSRTTLHAMASFHKHRLISFHRRRKMTGRVAHRKLIEMPALFSRLRWWNHWHLQVEMVMMLLTAATKKMILLHRIRENQSIGGVARLLSCRLAHLLRGYQLICTSSDLFSRQNPRYEKPLSRRSVSLDQPLFQYLQPSRRSMPRLMIRRLRQMFMSRLRLKHVNHHVAAS
ncbi:Uncharacterized protein PBTT_05379 [Plasmodiophora brassicae]